MSGAADCPTEFLEEDEPFDEQAFAPQQRVARTLAEVIAMKAGGRVIALVGKYGAGKTAVIRALASLCHASPFAPRIHVFRFDAWAHRGEALRRALVTKLAAFLQERGLLSAEDVTRVRDAIARRPDRTRGTSRPQAAWAAAWFGVASLAMQLAVAYMRTNNTIDLGPFAFTAVQAGLSVVWLTVAGALFSARGSALAAAFAPTAFTQTESETIRAPELTSIDFQEAFSLAVRTALGNERREDRLVCVMDDLDRLESEDDMRDVISTLRIFLDLRPDDASGGSLNKQVFDRVWFIVPHQFAALGQEAQSDRTEKLFSLRFDVPPVSLPSSSDYFTSRFLRAFPNHTAGDALEVYHLLLDTDASPTPRTMKWLLNRMAVLHLQRRCDVP